MVKPILPLVAAQLITLSRVGASLAFSVIAFHPQFRGLAIALFTYALFCDLFDGWFARQFRVTSRIGANLDASGDKFHTVVSVLYLAARGFSLTPCALLLLRDVLTAGLRAVWVQNEPLMPMRRWVGGLAGTPVKLLTLLVLLKPELGERHRVGIELCIWALAILTTGVLVFTLWYERLKIWRALNEE